MFQKKKRRKIETEKLIKKIKYCSLASKGEYYTMIQNSWGGGPLSLTDK